MRFLPDTCSKRNELESMLRLVRDSIGLRRVSPAFDGVESPASGGFMVSTLRFGQQIFPIGELTALDGD
jgi:hypothetical protein